VVEALLGPEVAARGESVRSERARKRKKEESDALHGRIGGAVSPEDGHVVRVLGLHLQGKGVS